MSTPRRVHRAIVVDDEQLARQRLVRLLATDPDIKVVAQCRNADEAIAALAAHDPDLVFLDIEMPQKDGFAVIDALGGARIAVIFVTAHPHHAVRAFEGPALDYLLKPFDAARLAKAVTRAKERLAQADASAVTVDLRDLLQRLKGGDRRPDRFLVKDGERAVFVKFQDVDWIEAESNYVLLHVGTTTHILRETLTAVEQRMDPASFRRIHRSTIVNLDRVREMHAWFHGEYRVILHSGAELRLSRRYKKNIEDLIGRQ
jgi:two-component system, LytTR family, response regulator